MATTLKKTNVVIVGLGAAGGVACLPLAEAGIDVIGLDSGPRLSTRDMAPDELRLNRGVWPPGPQKTKSEAPTFRANASAPAIQGNHPMMNAVGGTSIHYWAQSWRLSTWDFKVRSETVRRYGAGRIPKGSTIEDWPFDYAELEPYYDKVEYAIGVSGKAGNIGGKKDERGNIFEAPRKREFPMPPLRSTGFTERMATAAKSLGWHAAPGPAGIATKSFDGRPGCAYHGYCSGAGCHIQAKSSTAVSTIPKAEKTGHFSVVAEARVTKIEVDSKGRASGVTYIKGGEEFFQPADVVLVAGYVYENARLLLLSTSPAFPKGLSNNHGQVGRHYFSHNQGGAVSALFPFELNNWYGLPAQGVAVDNWADDNFDHAGLDFIGGGGMYVYTERRPIASVNGVAAWVQAAGKPTWGSAWKAFVKENADRTNSAYLQKTTLPYEDNYLDLDPNVKDSFGSPVIRITAEFKDNEKKIAAFMHEKMEQWYRAAGAVQIQRQQLANAMGPTTHAYGGTRMGLNPETNVVNGFGFSHEVPNLGILGASVMGTSGSRNPTLTLQAIAWRTAAHLASNWKNIAG
jgi:gluconate 2-dehydrogenase alpha chain